MCSQEMFWNASSEDLKNQLIKLGGHKLLRIIEVSSILSDGQKINIFDYAQLKNDQNLEVLPPFAGG